MALTKLEMWIAVITLVLIFGTTIATVGNDLQNKDAVTFDAKSQDYADNYGSYLTDNDISENFANETISEKSKNPLVSFASNLPVIQDVLGAINFFVDKTKVVFDYLALIYNLPTFFLQGLGLPVGAFAGIINIITTMTLIVLTIMAVRLVK
jgi:hypothetical protein